MTGSTSWLWWCHLFRNKMWCPIALRVNNNVRRISMINKTAETCQNHPSPWPNSLRPTYAYSKETQERMYTFTHTTHTGIIYAAFILSGQIQAIVYYNIEITVRVFVDAAAARRVVLFALSATGSTSLPCILVARTYSDDVNNSKYNSYMGHVNAQQQLYG